MKRKKNILLLIESSTPYGRRLLKGISLYVREHDQWTLHLEDRGLYSIPAQLLQGWKGDGIITRTSSKQIRKILDHCKCPNVELLSTGPNVTIEVRGDDQKAMELCFDHYTKKNISFIGFYAFGNCWWIKRRHNTFLAIAQERDVTTSCFVDVSARKVDLQPEWEERYQKPLERWLKSLPYRTGVIVVNDAQAMRVINTCRLLGINIPEQIAVLGIDNDEQLCNLMTPPISSLDQNVEMIGYKAAELLDLKINQKKLPPLPLVIPPKEIIERRSTEISAIDDPDIVAAIHYISEFATQGITVDEVANHVGLSHSTLCRLFKKTLQRSPKEEIIRVKINHALFLLLNSNINIQAIARRCGYKTVEHFTAVFKLHTGTTPAAFRVSNSKFGNVPTALHYPSFDENR